jgi:hypothetical protein
LAAGIFATCYELRIKGGEEGRGKCEKIPLLSPKIDRRRRKERSGRGGRRSEEE